MKLTLSPQAFKDLEKLDKPVARRVINKLKFFAAQTKPLHFAEPLTGGEFGDYRFRVGDWRVLCEIDKDIIFVLRIGHRREIYR